MLAAPLRPLFTADSSAAARELVGNALERLRRPLPKVAALLEEAEEDLLACYGFPADHWPKLRSTNPLERVNREIGRRTDVVGIFPNDRSLIRLAASIVIEQNDEWLVGRRYLSTTRSRRSSTKTRTKIKPERRPASSPRPEQPQIVPTSYTTSWDLTASRPRPSRRSNHDVPTLPGHGTAPSVAFCYGSPERYRRTRRAVKVEGGWRCSHRHAATAASHELRLGSRHRQSAPLHACGSTRRPANAAPLSRSGSEQRRRR
jgi:hypothetical protein